MKELSIEQKAKAYDERLTKARKEYSIHEANNAIGIMDALERVFPELAESEDERIREELLEHCRKQAEMYNTLQTAEEYSEVQSWIAWLEKQGEQKEQFEKDYTNLCNGIATAKGLSVAMAYDKGVADAKEQMMKDAVDAKITLLDGISYVSKDVLSQFKQGDKVKVIVIKED